jgi:hypothetical protein
MSPCFTPIPHQSGSFLGEPQRIPFCWVTIQFQALLAYMFREVNGARIGNPKLNRPKLCLAHTLAMPAQPACRCPCSHWGPRAASCNIA